METINYNELKIIDKDEYSSGTFGEIRRCILDGKLYALKTFIDPFYLVGKRMKIEYLSEVNQKELITPKLWVKKDDETSSYLTDWCDANDVGFLKKEENLNKKIKTLKKAKEAILVMHNENIIHGDLVDSNIIVDEKDNCYIIDFDNATYNGYDTFLCDVNDFSHDFIKKYGIRKEIDIFLFNLITFSVINGCKLETVRQNILQGNFRYFDNDDSKKICDTFHLDYQIPNKDFLIDTIDETSFTL